MKNKQSNDFLKEEPTGSKKKQSGMSNDFQKQDSMTNNFDRDEQEDVVVHPSKKEKEKNQYEDEMSYEYKQQHGSSKYGFGKKYDAAKFKKDMLEFNTSYLINLHRDKMTEY